MPSRSPVPQRVLNAFGAQGVPERIPGGPAWRCGRLVFKPVTDKARTVWLANVLGRLVVPDLRIARPVRATDGRWIVGGWAAGRYLEGQREHRHDETMLAALKLAQATAKLPRPDFFSRRQGTDALADRIAWGEADVPVEERKGGRWFEVLAVARRPVRLPDQVVPGDLFGAVLFDGPSPPGIVDFEPYYRPAEWGAAVVAVDAVAWGGADLEFLRRWSHLPEWSQLLLRALLFRLAGNALDPRATASSLDGLRAAAAWVSELL
ncbi:TIGR02569 family protein [Amycolatopsis alkalitolerans]|uniref:TIGR02569 family protein n=1 Tax=Amycolatopsis alkalitolerans TaxID=2547244 RepID=A0A5C4LV41_9PSEU|nr:TIGR02569 family protein [Amycolatopsis alkalitolerans]TNC23188.1 TIGR02569 family protein [Amycolatopsis alkalitolerans]